ncbi:hypothetical protein OAO55_02255 [Bacteroidales bacterium]|nr:hypothetical protein [Bacteroidales bacterium]
MKRIKLSNVTKITFTSFCFFICLIGCGIVQKSSQQLAVKSASYQTVIKNEAKIAYEIIIRIEENKENIEIDSVNFKGMQFVPVPDTSKGNGYYKALLSLDQLYPGTKYKKGDYVNGIVYTQSGKQKYLPVTFKRLKTRFL